MFVVINNKIINFSNVNKIEKFGNIGKEIGRMNYLGKSGIIIYYNTEDEIDIFTDQEAEEIWDFLFKISNKKINTNDSVLYDMQGKNSTS